MYIKAENNSAVLDLFQELSFALSNGFLLIFRDISKFAMHFIVEEIDQDTSMEDLQHMMLVALVYRVLVCLYEVSVRINHLMAVTG